MNIERLRKIIDSVAVALKEILAEVFHLNEGDGDEKE